MRDNIIQLHTKKLEHENISRLISMYKVMLWTHLTIFPLIDLYNYFNGIWVSSPMMYNVFITHIIALPFILAAIWVNKQYLNGSFNKLSFDICLGLNLIAILPVVLTYYYIDLVGSHSCVVMVIYVFILGFILRLSNRLQLLLSIYYLICFYGMLLYVGYTPAEYPSIYSTGITVIFVSFLISGNLYKQTKKSTLNEILLKKNNDQLDNLYTNLKDANDFTEEQNLALFESNKNLSNFAAVAAHDLKTPLRTISSFSGLLSQKYADKIEEEDKIMFDFMNTGCRDLTNIVNSLLEFSKVSGNETTKLNPVSLNKIVNTSIELLESRIAEQKASIHIADDFPTVMGVEGLLQQLVMNLMNNGIKFSAEGTRPAIEISYTSSFDTPNQIEVYVKDNGIGIPADQLDNIFQLFTKLHRTEEYEGSGIGLATCKKIVEKHGGKIRVESIEGEGSTFFFTLQLAKI